MLTGLTAMIEYLPALTQTGFPLLHGNRLKAIYAWFLFCSAADGSLRCLQHLIYRPHMSEVQCWPKFP